jgi:hypothetical protein
MALEVKHELNARESTDFMAEKVFNITFLMFSCSSLMERD